jgi:hypothetical protein
MMPIRSPDFFDHQLFALKHDNVISVFQQQRSIGDTRIMIDSTQARLP